MQTVDWFRAAAMQGVSQGVRNSEMKKTILFQNIDERKKNSKK